MITKNERHTLIDSIIRHNHKGMFPVDYLVYNDSFNALKQLNDEELLKLKPKRLFTIRINERIYETLCATTAWLFAGKYYADSMKSVPFDGKYFDGLIQVQ